MSGGTGLGLSGSFYDVHSLSRYSAYVVLDDKGTFYIFSASPTRQGPITQPDRKYVSCFEVTAPMDAYVQQGMFQQDLLGNLKRLNINPQAPLETVIEQLRQA